MSLFPCVLMEYCKFMLQATCDHDYLFTSLDAKWPGRVHDARIFRESMLCHRLERGMKHSSIDVIAFPKLLT